jgi:hypothetical protein
VTAFAGSALRDATIAAAVLAIVFGLAQFFAEAFGVARASPWHWVVPVVADVALVTLVAWPRHGPPSSAPPDAPEGSAEPT